MDVSFISKRVAQLRMEKDVSARDMSLSMGQSNNYVSNIENEKALPSIQGLFYICEYFEVSLKDFFDEGTKNTALFNELMKEAKELNPKALEHCLGLIRELKENG